MATITINLRSLGLTLTKGVEYRFDLDQGFVRDTTNQLPNPPNDNLLSFTTTGVTDFGISFGKGNNLILEPNTTFTVGPSTETYFVSDYIAAGYFSGSSGNIAIYNDDSTLLKSYAYEGDVLLSDDGTKIILDDTGMVATNQYHLVIDADIIYDSYNMLNETATPDFIMPDTGDNTIAGSFSDTAVLRHDDFESFTNNTTYSHDNLAINEQCWLYFERGDSTFVLHDGTNSTTYSCNDLGSGFEFSSEITMTNDTLYAVYGGTLKVYSATGGILDHNTLITSIEDSAITKTKLKVITSNKFITGDASALIVGEVSVSGTDRTITTHTISAESGAGTIFANKVAISDDYYACSDNNGVIYIYNVSDRTLVRSISTGYNGTGMSYSSTENDSSTLTTGGINDIEINGDDIIVALDNFGSPTSTKSRVYSITTGSENTSVNLDQGYRLLGDQKGTLNQKYFLLVSGVSGRGIYVHDRKTYAVLAHLSGTAFDFAECAVSNKRFINGFLGASFQIHN